MLFEGINTSTGISNTSADNKPVVYYDSTRDALITSKAENQKYGIYNVTGMQMISGIVTTNSINVSNLSKMVSISSRLETALWSLLKIKFITPKQTKLHHR